MTDKEELSRGDYRLHCEALEADLEGLRIRNSGLHKLYLETENELLEKVRDNGRLRAIIAAAPAPADPSATTEESSTAGKKLWAVHAQGPDELYPAFNREDAERHAAALNELSAGCSINVSAVVIESPWPAAEHWKYLAEQEREHVEQIAAPVERVEQAKVFWVLFDNTGGEKFIKKCADTGSLAFFDSEADAARAKRINPGTDYKCVEYYTTPQPAEPAPDVAVLVESLECCKQWFEMHSPTAQLISGEQAEHPMLTSICKTLAAHQRKEGE